jgi:uncharacterized protein (DUF1330 family)
VLTAQTQAFICIDLDQFPATGERQNFCASIKISNQEETMKQYFGLGLGLIAGTVIGAAAVTGLHAQATPPAYVVAEIDVTNQEAFLKEYTPLAIKALANSGSKALARGGKVVPIEGTPPKSRIVINGFASLDAAVAAYNSPAYKEARTIGNKHGAFRIYAVEGLAP